MTINTATATTTDTASRKMDLHIHLMHPGGESAPGDPNAAFYLDGTYHLHYILQHEWKDRRSFSFVHVTSPDMLHWTWHETKLQPAFTGHGMFSGTGFVTDDGRPAIIYHGQASDRNHITIATDRQLSAWEPPYAIEPLTSDGQPNDIPIRHWDPDCFRIGDTWYAISGGTNPPLLKSRDLREWRVVGDFLAHEPDDVAIGEDVSCANFFELDGRWVLLCISHAFGCRYYVGDWDAEAEQFVPQHHARMNWRRPGQSIHNPWHRDIFAPESLCTDDGRRVMWAWIYGEDETYGQLTLQSLPRELRLSDAGELLQRPLRELEKQRGEPRSVRDLYVEPPVKPHSAEIFVPVATVEEEAYEIRVRVARAQAERKRFGLQLFADEQRRGLTIMLRPEASCLQVGETEVPFRVADLPEGEDVELRIFVDKYLVEVFANERVVAIATDAGYAEAKQIHAYSFGTATTFADITVWPLAATTQGFAEALSNRIWEPKTAS